jgi:hypothetical protein
MMTALPTKQERVHAFDVWIDDLLHIFASDPEASILLSRLRTRVVDDDEPFQMTEIADLTGIPTDLLAVSYCQFIFTTCGKVVWPRGFRETLQ